MTTCHIPVQVPGPESHCSNMAIGEIVPPRKVNGIPMCAIHGPPLAEGLGWGFERYDDGGEPEEAS